MKKKKIFLFDIDGTLAVGNTLFDGSAELLKHIEGIGGKAYYITNNSTQSGADYVKKFRTAFGLETTEDLFVTSGYLTLKFLKENYGDKKIYVLGTKSYVEELRKNQLTVTEQYEEGIDCVLVGFDSELNYAKLTEASKILQTTDVPFYATNPDLRCPIDFGFVPDCGAICNMLTATTGKTPIYLGKPNKEMVEHCLTASGFTKEETLVVGDRLYTDIACGINAAVDTCLVFTGEATLEDVKDTPYPPTFTAENVRDLLNQLRKSRK